MTLRRQLRFVVMGRWWKWALIRVLIQYHLQLSVIQLILRDQCSYQRAFWLCRGRDQQFLYQWCSVLWLSRWLRLPSLSSIVLGGRVVCRFQFWLHRRQLVPNQVILLLGRSFQLQSMRIRCWMLHYNIRWSCLIASDWIPCSRQKSSRRALPTWIPPCPMWIEMTSLIVFKFN